MMRDEKNHVHTCETNSDQTPTMKNSHYRNCRGAIYCAPTRLSNQNKTMYVPSRRDVLRWFVGLGAGAVLPISQRSNLTPTPTLSPYQALLQDNLVRIIGDLEIGLDVRKLDENQQVSFRVQHHSEELYPVASAFKAFVLFYYFWHVPQDQWQYAQGSTAYSVGVYSNNTATGTLIQETDAYVDVYGNPIEKFNDFLIYNLRMVNGLYGWNWETNPLVGYSDERFVPSDTRYVQIGATQHPIDNLTSAADLAYGYTFLAQAAAGTLAYDPLNPLYDRDHAQLAAIATLNLLSIEAEDYQSPIERAGFVYTGKDGILPLGDVSVGNVVNDAGIVKIGKSRYVLAYMSASQSEYLAIETLKAVGDLLKTFEGV